MKGVVAAGSQVAVDAGLHALREGGNAVDAAVAAQLAAAVSEPILTGLLGGGMAMVWKDGRAEVCDGFGNMPSGQGNPPERVVLDYGVTTQSFHIGTGTFATPGLAIGLWTLHEKHGRLPFSELVRPAAKAARQGVPLPETITRIIEILWPLCGHGSGRRILGTAHGHPPNAGDLHRNPALAETLEAFGREGPALFRSGSVAKALLSMGTACTAADFLSYEAIFRPALALDYRGFRVFTPGPPSQGGPGILRALQILAEAPLPEALGAAHVEAIARALGRAIAELPRPLPDALWADGFAGNYLGSGFTTHTSSVDEEGCAVAITSSLGESCGEADLEHGLLLNNFLGEEDVNPPGHPRPAGKRLMTMTSPSVAVGPGKLYALGSGGSNRIRSALLHGFVYMLDHGWSPAKAVAAPRCHMEDGQLRVESWGRPEGVVSALAPHFPGLGEFTEPGVYFGGLNVAARLDGELEGGGDPRRSGAWGVAG